MAYTFDEIMAFHPDNAVVYQEIKELLPKLVPFVGAGLTQFVYCSWPKALEMLSNKLTDRVSVQEVNDLIASKDYLGAAQLLEDLRKPVNLARDLAGIFSASKLEQKWNLLPHEPISLLPYLFPDLVLTTNFDEVLETVYSKDGQPFQTIFPPGHSGLLRQLMKQGGVRGLLKLHGTVTGKFIGYDKIVFTKAQYDQHYGRNSPLTCELRDCFENRVMLFLGCSLDRDRTMDLLQDIIQPGDIHYAIINCARPERDRKIRQLGDNHIRAILYEGDRHEAVRIILEHLLEETDPEAYHRLPIHVGALKLINPSERFSYKADTPFVGRRIELDELNAFLGDAHIAFRWWAITGPGGSGKSRLAYEFQKQLPLDWSVYYLNSADYVDLSVLTTKLARKTLVIADYVQENAKEIGKWMEQVNERSRSLPIRVLLVERDSNVNEIGSGWAKQIYTNVRYEQRLKNACYKEGFLELKPLGDSELLDIIENYSLAPKQSDEYSKCVLSPTIKHMLLSKLKSIDSVLCRPLYALFLTDAYLTGNSPEHWDRKDVLDYIVIREQGRLKFNIKQILGKFDERLYSTCLYLYCVATVLQDSSLKDIQLLWPDIWDVIQKKADCFTSPADMLKQIGLLEGETVYALRPDLIGEYFVYTWLCNHPNEAQPFLRSVWRRFRPTVVFFNRMIHDYGYLVEEHWELVLLNDIPKTHNIAYYYATLLTDAIDQCSGVTTSERPTNLLKKVASKYHYVPDIIIVLASGLVNLSVLQDEQSAWETAAFLEHLAAEHPNMPDLTIRLAGCLCNISGKQDEQEKRKAVMRLEHLAIEYPDISDIVIMLSSSLFHLSVNGDEQGIRDAVARLERLITEHPDVPDIAIKLAKSLVNLCVHQNEWEVAKIIDRLEQLNIQYPDIPDISITYAMGLASLSIKQNEQGARETIVLLEHLATEHPHISDVVIELARGLAALSGKQDKGEEWGTIARMKRLVVEHPDLPDIMIQLANTLVNVSCDRDAQEAQKAVGCLEALAAEHNYPPDITIRLAESLVNLSGKQDEQGRRETIAHLEILSVEHPDMPDVVIKFANGLVNLSIKQDEQGIRETIVRLEKLAVEHPEIPDITIMVAKSLVNLVRTQDGLRAWKTIARLEQLVAEYPKVQDIVIELARGLYNLSYYQDEREAQKTIAYLELLAAKHHDIPGVAIELANGLLSLSYNQDEQGAKETITRMERLTVKYPNMPDIAIRLAQGLFNLSSKQDENGAKETIVCLEHLVTEYPDILDIKVYYADSLVNLSIDQNKQEAQRTMARVEYLATKHSDVPYIIFLLAKGLFNLINKQDEKEAEETVICLKSLVAKYPDVPNIAIPFAKGLVELSRKQDEQKARETIAYLKTFFAEHNDLFPRP